jgi:AraC-like DNA-binding protein
MASRPQSRVEPAGSFVRVGGPQSIPVVLRQLGADPAAVFAEAGIDLALFDNPNNLLPLATVARLAAVSVDRTGCPHFGLLVGAEGGLGSLGLAGLLAKHSPDVGSALRGLVHAMHWHVHGVVPSIVEDGDFVLLTCDVRLSGDGALQIEDGSMAQLFNSMRSLCGPAWLPSEVRFAHREPKDPRPYRQFFKAPLRFDAEQNALVFSSNWMTRRLVGADDELRRLVQQEIDGLDGRHGDEFPEQVRSVLRAALLTGHGSAEQVAALFSMHSRTLGRRLRAFDTSFQELVDETRFEIARHALANTAMEVTQIAASLDYADTSAFTRAFRRWSGTTPGRWRAGRRVSGSADHA